MKDWLNIKEASKAVGKHPDTIRNLIKKHPEAVKRDEKGKIFIKAELLRNTFAVKEESAKPQQAKEEPQVLEALLAELKQKNDEINRLHKLIEEMTGQQAQLIDQQQKLSGFMLQAQNPIKEEEPPEQPKPKKKHWWSK